MTVLGIDDTDSRTAGMCSTYLAALVAEAIEDAGATVHRRLLVRLNPAVEHKTRGNAALALHTDADPAEALAISSDLIAEYAVADDPRTSPGVVVADRDPEAVPDAVADFARDAVREFHDLGDALALADEVGFDHRGWGSDGEPSADTAGGDGDSDDNGDGAGEDAVVGRGRIGALAAVGAWRAFDDWTYEHISYREFERCGTPREVDEASVFAAAEEAYPLAWDTVDRDEGEAVCVPNAPGPILYGIRGDDPEAVRRVADGIDGEPVERSALFVTNQGTDAHLRKGTLGDLREGGAYRLECEVSAAPETRRGGHVFFEAAALGGGDAVATDDVDGDGPEAAAIDCVAFEPTKRFRDRVRDLRVGDRLTLCGEVADGTLKLEKFAVRDLVETVPAVPECPDCGRSMNSAGANQGYRCRDCGTSEAGKVEAPLERDLEPGWYEVPPCARRHISKPLVRGGFDAPTHPER
ncbi:tRNA(Ile)(2)-agmatinylcytidine synthase [Halobaculum magnesiiphilum]|uniref:tRNA(Ile2) 2-agmatinylcytidine synthetase TiaS n=1 Tax=Halobaculum magnesiiphilum TaxID=1017351 RepID=A0A8T8WCL7_9EURY|nr:tRNA(Ile)(2)-agmatinylcytidine synthase [Halobaculum magnesiiphilum]QZP37589.1 tRNA(Ile)(2)-agmatinylcytidine synthase [Halobaculum magnesiiphilum]